MVKFIKGRWFPLSIAAITILIIASVLFFFGFRITYAPKLENSWDAISSVAAWGGVIAAIASATASFLAVWFAIRVPQKIAEQQNKIALFEKRRAIYEILVCCSSFALSIERNPKLVESEENIMGIRSIFVKSFSYKFADNDKSESKINEECLDYAVRAKIMLDTAQFLFVSDFTAYAKPISFVLFNLLFPADSEQAKVYCKKYQAIVKKMEQELFPKIEQELSLLK